MALKFFNKESNQWEEIIVVNNKTPYEVAQEAGKLEDSITEEEFNSRLCTTINKNVETLPDYNMTSAVLGYLTLAPDSYGYGTYRLGLNDEGQRRYKAYTGKSDNFTESRFGDCFLECEAFRNGIFINNLSSAIPYIKNAEGKKLLTRIYPGNTIIIDAEGTPQIINKTYEGALKVTYAKLLEYIENNSLNPGQYYRIERWAHMFKSMYNYEGYGIELKNNYKHSVIVRANGINSISTEATFIDSNNVAYPCSYHLSPTGPIGDTTWGYARDTEYELTIESPYENSDGETSYEIYGTYRMDSWGESVIYAENGCFWKFINKNDTTDVVYAGTQSNDVSELLSSWTSETALYTYIDESGGGDEELSIEGYRSSIRKVSVGQGYISYMEDNRGNSAPFNFIAITYNGAPTFSATSEHCHIGANSTVVPINTIDGKYNTINGYKNYIKGDHNIVEGWGSQINGDNNYLVLDSHNNVINGRNNRLESSGYATLTNCTHNILRSCSYVNLSNCWGNTLFGIKGLDAKAILKMCTIEGWGNGITITAGTTSNNAPLQNVHIKPAAASGGKIDLTDWVDKDYDITVSKNSKGEIKIYCEADLIQ